MNGRSFDYVQLYQLEGQELVIYETAPETTAVVNGTVRSDGTYNSHVVLLLTAEGGTGSSEIQYSLDGTNWFSYTAPLEFNDNGTYTISYRAADSAGNAEEVKSVSFVISMNPDIMVSYLKDKVNAETIHNGIKNSLVSKLDSALSLIMSGDKYSSVNIMNDFINEVSAQREKKLTDAQADEMIAEANKIKTRILEAVVFDIPGKAVLSDDNGQDTGLMDGDYTITMNLWWGSNATTYKLYEDGVLIDTQDLTANTPNTQTAETVISGKANGSYTYYCELINEYGTTASDVITVNVTQANPGQPVLSNDNWDGDGSYTVKMDMWFGVNGTIYKLYENGVLIDTQDLTANTPNVQSARTSITEKGIGEYTYYCELINSAGMTTSEIITVNVTK